MKAILKQLDKAFDSRVRLGIMSVLVVNEEIDFVNLKEFLDVSDGNLASHIKSLEKLEYIQIRKRFIGKKPNTTYYVTMKGQSAFERHLSALEQLIKR